MNIAVLGSGLMGSRLGLLLAEAGHTVTFSIAAMLIKDTGFNPVNVGSLKNARYTEPFAMLTVQLAWFRNDGPMLTYQFRLNDQAIQDNK